MTILAERRIAIEPRRVAPLFCRGYCGCQGGADSLMCASSHPPLLSCESCDPHGFALKLANQPRLVTDAWKRRAFRARPITLRSIHVESHDPRDPTDEGPA